MKISLDNRFAGRLPKVGIRPIVDARQMSGARQKCEKITIALCENIQRLIGEKLRYPNGTPVECVIPPAAISGVTEAEEAADFFRREGVGVSVSVAISWCYPVETIDLDPLTPKCVIGMNNSDGSGAVYLAALQSACNQFGIPCFGIYGRNVQPLEATTLTPDCEEKLLCFVKAGIAAAYMRGKTYLSVGSVSMGIAGSMTDEAFFRCYLGMRTQMVDMSEITRRIEKGIYEPDACARAKRFIKKRFRFGEDYNPAETQISDEEKRMGLDTAIKMALITKDLMQGNPKLEQMGYPEESKGYNALAGGFQGQRHWTDFMPVGDLHEAMLNTTFDWDGIRQPYIFGTENDSLNAATMLLGHLLTGSAQIFADIRTYWSPESVVEATGKRLEGRAAGGIIHLANSGPAALDGTGAAMRDGKPVMKPFWEMTDEDVEACLCETQWCPAETLSFAGYGYHTRIRTRGEMPVTLMRINLVKGVGPTMQLAQGYIVDIPQEIHDVIDKRTSPAWPTSWFVPELTGQGAFTDVYTVMARWGSNHGSFSYGHIGADVLALCAMLRIPVIMHNVGYTSITRPAAWDAFGLVNSVEADMGACRYYGPLYGKY
jgi:L-fucose isomerase